MARALASLCGNHSWMHSSRDLQVVGCCQPRSGQPICYEGQHCHWLLGGRSYNWLGSWVPCEPERRLTAWPRGQRGHCNDSWWFRRLIGDQWLWRSHRSRWIDAIWSADLLRVMWKASRSLELTARRVQVSAAYTNTYCTRAWKISSTVDYWNSVLRPLW